MRKRFLLSKVAWKNADGAFSKPRRLRLKEDKDGIYNCPVNSCDSFSFKTKCGCRKHVSKFHGWYFYFDVKPKLSEVLPQFNETREGFTRNNRRRTSDMPLFDKKCHFAVNFRKWLSSHGSKSVSQALQICKRTLKYLKFCCPVEAATWDIPKKCCNLLCWFNCKYF